ncbi:MAG: hypothetical protein M3O87_06790, partial [Candidatus Dormibacteraeota bacterium]|nr:hypothetical protein [Candidatus Dormibacteraeota bacterium]
MKPLAPACVALAIATCLSACDVVPPPKPTQGGTLTVALAADPPTLNRFLASDPVSLRASAPLFPNLFTAQPDMSFTPDLAESMPQISDDGKTWT